MIGPRLSGPIMQSPCNDEIPAPLLILVALTAELHRQLKVRNAIDEATPMPLRYNGNFTGLSRTQLFEPRSFRLTTGLDF